MTDERDDDLLNCRQASRALQISVADLKRMRVGQAGPPFVMRKGSVAYRRSDLEAWAASVRQSVHR
jgi:predicted DNA-binding transcriptional regulator AlpA